MTRSQLWRPALIALAALSMTTTAYADRRTGLAGSLLIEDEDDVFAFPQLLTTYRNRIWLDYGPNDGTGNGILTLGNEGSAFGLAIHRGDVLAPHLIDRDSASAALGGVTSVAGPGTFVDPATIVDFLYGGGDFGLRASLGRGSMVSSLSDSDTGEAEFYAMVLGGYGSGTRGQDTRFDLSASLTLDLGAAVSNNNDTFSGMYFNASALARAFIPMDSTLDLGILGDVFVESNSVTNEQAVGDPSNSLLSLGLTGGLGPAFRLGPANVAGYAVLHFQFTSNDPDSEINDDEVDALTVVIPGVHMAFEVPVTDWFYVRSGAEYLFALDSTSGPDDEGSSSNNGSFGWNAGIGVLVDDFRFDGALEHGFVTGGPDFLGGEGGGMFFMASMTYNFDAARSGATPTPEAEPEPEPEPEPAPALAPAPPPVPPPAPTVEGNTSGEIGIGGSLEMGTQPPPPAPAAPPAPAPAPAPAPTR